MRKIAYIFPILIWGLVIVSCHNGNKEGSTSETEVSKSSSPNIESDTLLVITMPENALWGHLGEGTGMSVLEFITDNGDTIYINKESEITGHIGIIYGSIRNYTDRFCISTTDGGQTLLKAVNVTQMQEIWSDDAHSERNYNKN